MKGSTRKTLGEAKRDFGIFFLGAMGRGMMRAPRRLWGMLGQCQGASGSVGKMIGTLSNIVKMPSNTKSTLRDAWKDVKHTKKR
jgi:hypothetical protein